MKKKSDCLRVVTNYKHMDFRQWFTLLEWIDITILVIEIHPNES